MDEPRQARERFAQRPGWVGTEGVVCGRYARRVGLGRCCVTTLKCVEKLKHACLGRLGWDTVTGK